MAHSRFPSPSRRDFLRTAALATAGALVSRVARAASPVALPPPSAPIPVIASGEWFKWLSSDEMCQLATLVGWAGIEPSVMEGGQISPTQIRDDLPRFMNAAQRHGLDIIQMSTDITTLRDPAAEGVLRTAANAGIKRVRLGIPKIDRHHSIDEQMQTWKVNLRDLDQLCDELQIDVGVENAWNPDYFGTQVSQILEAIAGSKHVGIFFNPSRALLVSKSAYSEQCTLSRPKLLGVYAEDFVPPAGAVAPNTPPQPCPLGEGISEPGYYRHLRSASFDGTVCQRYAYPLGKPDASLAHCRTDLATLQNWLGQFTASPFR